MPPLADPELLARYLAVLSEWHVTGFVDYKDTAREWIKKNLPDQTLKDVAKLMYNHVAAGGQIDQVPERRPEWNDRDFHYDLRVSIGGKLRYIETLWIDD